jgi:ribonuclease VapC
LALNIRNHETEKLASDLAALIEQSDTCLLSAANFLEASIVIENNRGYDGLRDFDLLMAAAGIELAPVDADQAHIARQAFRRYGKGHHPAGLNFLRDAEVGRRHIPAARGCRPQERGI